MEAGGMMQLIKRNAKAFVLLLVVIVAAIAQFFGVDVGLDLQHYIALLVADLAVWAVPNQYNEEA